MSEISTDTATDKTEVTDTDDVAETSNDGDSTDGLESISIGDGDIGEAGDAGIADLEGSLSAMLDRQIRSQQIILYYNLLSNLQNAKHSNSKSMSDKIGNS